MHLSLINRNFLWEESKSCHCCHLHPVSGPQFCIHVSWLHATVFWSVAACFPIYFKMVCRLSSMAVMHLREGSSVGAVERVLRVFPPPPPVWPAWVGYPAWYRSFSPGTRVVLPPEKPTSPNSSSIRMEDLH